VRRPFSRIARRSLRAGPVARSVAVAIGIAFVAVVTVAVATRLFMMVF
jgi:hypothetical protein